VTDPTGVCLGMSEQNRTKSQTAIAAVYEAPVWGGPSESQG